MKQKNNTNTIIGLVILVILILLAVVYENNLGASTPPPAQQTTTTTTTTITTAPIATSSPINTTSSWQSLSSSTTGITFKYPTASQLNLGYIQTADWPPSITVSNNTFSCNTSGTVIGQYGQTSMKTINGSQYCATVQSEGAAGSVYTTYAYAFPQDGKTLTLNFTLRAPQCENYPDPQMTACKNEESTFSVDSLADAMAKTVEYVRLVSPAQPIKPVAPPTTPIIINSVSPTSGPVGTTMTIIGNGFTPDGNKVLFNGNVAAANIKTASSTNNDQTLVITVPSGIGPDCKANEACPMYEELVTPNTYIVTIENSRGISNTLSFVVTASQ